MRKSYRRNSKKKNSRRLTIRFLFIVLILAAIIFFVANEKNPIDFFKGLAQNKENTSSQASSDNTEGNKKVIPPDTTINMAVIGDIMCHNSQYNDAYDASTKKYDFSYVFTDVEKYIQEADIAVGNIETTFAGAARGYSNYPTFNSPEALAYDIKEMGIDFLTTANNHSMDKGYTGLVSTLDFLDDAGIKHTGTYRSKEEQNTIQVMDVNGIKIAFIAFTYGTNGIPVPSGKEYCINLLDNNLILEQIELAKKENPDLICAFMHWGVEYQYKQNKQQESYANLLFENGVDVILGGHAHVLQPMEKRTITLADGTTKDGFVIYSQGNFISGQRDDDTKTTVILNLKLTKNGETGKMSIDEADYIPLYMYKSSTGTVKKYKLLDMRSSIAKYESGENTSIGAATYNTLKKYLAFAENILGQPIKKQEVVATDSSTNETTTQEPK